MSVLELLKGSMELTLEFLGQAAAEDLRDLVGRHSPQSQLTTALEDLWIGKLTFEDEVAAVLDLGDGVEAAQVYPLTFLVGELRSQDQRPVVQTLPDDSGLRRSTAACRAFTSSTARKALSFLRKPTWARFSSCSMKEWPFSQ